MNKTKNPILTIIKVFVILLLIKFTADFLLIEGIESKNSDYRNNKDYEIKILSSSENKDFEKELKSFAASQNIDLEFEYAGNLEIIDILNERSEEYDIVWNSNSIWNYMLDDSSLLSKSVSVSTNPVVFAVRKSKAHELNLDTDTLYTEDIVSQIRLGNLKFSMSNPTQTNSGASTYLGLLSVFSGNPEVLKSEHLQNEELKNTLNQFFENLDRSSGSEDYLEEIILKNEYDIIATYEFSIINMNKKLIANGEEPFYLLYPEDGVSISDSPFSYIDNNDDLKKEAYDILSGYLLSNEGQEKLAALGRRTWYGGVTDNVDKTVFNPDWGIDTGKYIVPIKYPHKDIIKESLALYQNELRRPMAVVFCLDYSGSMQGAGKNELVSAMDYILDVEEASKDYIQFSADDIIYVIPFSGEVMNVWGAYAGVDTEDVLEKIHKLSPTGSTNIYDTLVKALNVIEPYNDYAKSVILMTDGKSNRGTYTALADYYRRNSDVPVYSIEFGEADSSEIEKINELTGGKSFDGKTDLLKAFKQVRGYN